MGCASGGRKCGVQLEVGGVARAKDGAVREFDAKGRVGDALVGDGR